MQDCGSLFRMVRLAACVLVMALCFVLTAQDDAVTDGTGAACVSWGGKSPAGRRTGRSPARCARLCSPGCIWYPRRWGSPYAPIVRGSGGGVRYPAGCQAPWCLELWENEVRLTRSDNAAWQAWRPWYRVRRRATGWYAGLSPDNLPGCPPLLADVRQQAPGSISRIHGR